MKWVANSEWNDVLITSSLYVWPFISKHKATFWTWPVDRQHDENNGYQIYHFTFTTRILSFITLCYWYIGWMGWELWATNVAISVTFDVSNFPSDPSSLKAGYKNRIRVARRWPWTPLLTPDWDRYVLRPYAGSGPRKRPSWWARRGRWRTDRDWPRCVGWRVIYLCFVPCGHPSSRPPWLPPRLPRIEEREGERERERDERMRSAVFSTLQR